MRRLKVRITYLAGMMAVAIACVLLAPLTANAAIDEAVEAESASASAASSTHVYRLWNTSDGQHLITASENEYKVLQRRGWKAEGNMFNAPSSGNTSVYRLYNRSNGDHLYTADANEYRSLQHNGWTGEGTQFYGASSGSGTPIYRLWNTGQTGNGGAGSHLWTSDRNEYTKLPRINSAWRQENVAWYGEPVPALPANPSTVGGSSSSSTTLYGTVVREEWTTYMTGWGYAGAFYFLQLDKPITVIVPNNMTGQGGTSRVTTSKVQLDLVELNMADDRYWGKDVNAYLGTAFSAKLQPYTGFRVKVTGKSFGMGSRTIEPNFSYTSISRYD